MSEYLWDRSGDVDPEVADLEQELQALRFDPAAHPLALAADTPRPAAVVATPARRRWRPLSVVSGLMAASLVAMAGTWALHHWRLDWQAGRAWTVHGQAAQLGVGDTLDVSARNARVDIARLGVLDAHQGTSLGLQSTGPERHQLTLNRGDIDVRVWAPPGRVRIQTPAGEVIDMGCIFSLSVDDRGVAHLSVDTGWVSLNNVHGSEFIPAGASSDMRADREPRVPVYDDAPRAFRSAVRALEDQGAGPSSTLLRDVIGLARERDVITLLRLAQTLESPSRDLVLERAALLFPPPAEVTVESVAAGNVDDFWQWYDALPLPALKNWWLNWRDVFPR